MPNYQLLLWLADYLMDSTTLSFDGSEGGMGQSLGLGVAAIIGLSFCQGVADRVSEFPKVLVINGGVGEQTG